MSPLQMITFRCKPTLFERLEKFAVSRNIDRTSVLKLAVHYYLNRHGVQETPPELSKADAHPGA